MISLNEFIEHLLIIKDKYGGELPICLEDIDNDNYEWCPILGVKNVFPDNYVSIAFTELANDIY